MNDKLWEPLSCLNGPGQDIALIKLNTPLEDYIESFRNLWQKAKMKILVDGAVNELDTYRIGDDPEFLPDLVTGDFDSAKPEILHRYKEKGVEVIHTPDQNQTDFTKCLKVLIKQITAKDIKVSSIIAFVSFAGRLDHVLGNLNTLYLCREFTQLPIYLYSGDSLTFLLSPGSNRIHLHERLRYGFSCCGLIPLGSPSKHVTTTGLKWNLVDKGMEFGGLVSTSNRIDADVVTVNTDAYIVWCMSKDK